MKTRKADEVVKRDHSGFITPCDCEDCDNNDPITTGKQPQHTRTPWSYDLEDEAILDSNGDLINTWNDGKSKDAAYIVKCVNSHEALVSFVEWVSKGAKGQSDNGTVECSWEYVQKEASRLLGGK